MSNKEKKSYTWLKIIFENKETAQNTIKIKLLPKIWIFIGVVIKVSKVLLLFKYPSKSHPISTKIAKELPCQFMNSLVTSKD